MEDIMSKREFMDDLIPIVTDMYYEYDILPSVLLSLIISTSNWGEGCLGNNLMKLEPGRSWEGLTVTKIYRKEIVIQTEIYRRYKSVSEGIEDYITSVLRNDTRFYGIYGNECYRSACKVLSTSGEHFDHDYYSLLTNLIYMYKLDDLDEEVLNSKKLLEEV